MSRGHRVTIHDVASAAAVSSGTVSRVLNGGTASAGARTAVERALTRTGYLPNRNARRGDRRDVKVLLP